jgi:uncharacterized protein
MVRLSDFTITSFDQMLGTLDHILTKAAADPRGDALLNQKLIGDMNPLSTQIRFVTHQVVNTLNRLTGTTLPTAVDDHETIANAKAEIAALRELVRATSDDAIVADETPVEFDLPNGMAFAMTAGEYVRDWSLPQFYFHLMAAYSILRQAGLSLGKADYVGYMARFAKMPATS